MLDHAGPRPDLLHVQCPSSQLWYAAEFSRRNQIPLVITTQGETEMDAGRLYQRNPWMRRTLRHAASQAAALTACSGWTRNHAQRMAPAFQDASIILNGIDLRDWDMPAPGQAPVIAAWGRLVPQKGFDLLLSAFGEVRKRLPGAQLLLAGAGNVEEAGLVLPQPGVTFLGPLDRQGVRDLIAQARVVAVPSRIEPFGIVALEALAAGRGLVYSNRGGLDEAAGGCGRAADPHDTKAFADALIDELNRPTPPAQAHARTADVTWGLISQQYRNVYVEVMRNARRPG
jgi:glycosyltransferase involved in cell wall biosynthesis